MRRGGFRCSRNLSKPRRLDLEMLRPVAEWTQRGGTELPAGNWYVCTGSGGARINYVARVREILWALTTG
jgi:hypothetical protein